MSHLVVQEPSPQSILITLVAAARCLTPRRHPLGQSGKLECKLHKAREDRQTVIYLGVKCTYIASVAPSEYCTICSLILLLLSLLDTI